MNVIQLQALRQSSWPARSGAPGVAFVYSFAGFRFDARSGLSWGGRRVPLAPTEARALAALLEAGGAIVAKDDLAERVWNGAPASDNSISRAICAIRRALRSRSDERIVETIYGCGFRIDVPVQREPPPTGAGTDSPAGGLLAATLTSLGAARELVRRGAPADLECAAAEIDRIVGLLVPLVAREAAAR